MKAGLIALIIIHGLIHLMGFLKAFNLAKIDTLNSFISKPVGITWFIVCLLFILTAVLYLTDYDVWWGLAIVAIILSQVLIISVWKEAKFGTLANLLILTPAIIACATFYFNKMVANERALIIAQSQTHTISDRKISDLPPVVQLWLTKSGVTNTRIPNQVNVIQSLQMKLDESQENWVPAKATQLFTPTAPAFNWQVKLKPNLFMPIVGRDEYFEGKGGMLIKLLGMYPIVDVADNKRINEAALQRYLAEICWFPQAALSEFITWRAIDSHSAEATIHHFGTIATGIFQFDDTGNFRAFKTMRYKGVEEGDEKVEWTVSAVEHQTINDIKVPTKLEAEWNLPTGKWKWLKLQVDSVSYTFE
ncbi:DUF6920 family protein [Fulvivirga lutea]|uniref:Uncharacterized protein n=1 Tax=Fulvivirga lutea TaxID=2810512 RepID=A0A975A2Z2_9BACT|nr:DUF6544 family protein [Fulvivirga lutea]QSE99057.1 hypothetical protein JR347_08215 [Fulvivirga lutea]